MGVKYFAALVLCMLLAYGIDSGSADICYDSSDSPELICPDNIFYPSETYCCGISGSYDCCTYDEYQTYNDIVDTISSAIIAVIVISIIIPVAIIAGIIACCVCGCCAATTRPKTRTIVTTQPQQGQVMIQQPYNPQQPGYAYPPQQQQYPPGTAYPPSPAGAAYPPQGAAYPPPAYNPPPVEKV